MTGLSESSKLHGQWRPLKIVYVASAIRLDSASGGATHVSEVASGLTALGHKVRVIVRSHSTPTAPAPDLDLKALNLHPMTAMLGSHRISRELRRSRPDVLIERYYNFAGAGIWQARRQHIPSMLEVNAPMIDPPGTLKSRIDHLLLGAMRRWAARQARWSRAIVTPLATTVPPEVSRRKIHELPWGANIEHFSPASPTEKAEGRYALQREYGVQAGGPLFVFLGSFRGWHGALNFAEAVRRMLNAGSDAQFMAIGEGPELETVREHLSTWDITSRFTLLGAQPHEIVPQLLRAADVGVAPFDLAAHPPLQTFGFYWSPLKVFEYMASGLSVVTIRVHPLDEIVRHEREGLLYTPGDTFELVSCLLRLAKQPELAAHLGRAARERVAEHYSWQSHCVALDRILQRISRAA